MTLQELARIACYLNLATDKIKGAGGDIEWLTGTSKTVTCDKDAPSEETQCLSWGNTLWIANNNDDDSATQLAFLTALGIGTSQALVTHVKSAHALRVLPSHKGDLVPGSFTAKGKLFYSLVGNGATKPGGEFAAPGGAVSIGTFKLSSTTTSGLTTGISFVTGSYDGTGGDALHAEQKLLAALGKLCATWKPRGEVNVGGIKSACTTCAPVLESVYTTMIRLDYGVYLKYETPTLKEKRIEAKLPVVGVTGIRSLAVGTYFT